MVKLGLTEQKINPQILNLLDVIEIKNINNDKIKEFQKFGKEIILHCQNIFQRKHLFINDLDFVKVQTSLKLKKLIKSLKLKSLSYHLGTAGTNYKVINNEVIIKGALLTKKEILQTTINHIAQIKKAYLDKEIYLENNPYQSINYGKDPFEHLCQPSFITEIIKKTKCSFLLDIGHAEVSSENLKFKSIEDYLQKLPLDAVREIHVHKSGYKDGYSCDRHLAIDSKEIDILKFILKKSKNVKYIILEAQGKHDHKTLIKELQLLSQFRK